MIFAQYLHMSTDYGGPPSPIAMCGSDGVYICDGRKTLAHQISDATAHYHKLRHIHRIVGLQMFRGSSFSCSWPITKEILFDGATAVSTQAAQG